MKRVLDLVVDRPVGTCMLLLSLVVLGAVAVVRLPLDFMPPIIEIRTVYFPLYFDLDLKVPAAALSDGAVECMASTIASVVSKFYEGGDARLVVLRLERRLLLRLGLDGEEALFRASLSFAGGS